MDAPTTDPQPSPMPTQEVPTPAVEPEGAASGPKSSPPPRARQDPPVSPPRPADRPARRPLRIYTFDPMLAATRERIGPATVTVGIPWEPLEPGPSGARVQVIDFDGGRVAGPSAEASSPGRAATGFYAPVDLDQPTIAVQAGLAPSESDPRFHQQMVYAVAMRTLEAYDRAVGRRIRPHGGRLRLFPHALRDDNAFFHPALKGVLFGYFEADMTNPGPNLPGQFVYTCLSHDIIAHEVTHALIHDMRPLLLARTNADVAAFHEAVADLTAIFLHFTLPGVVEATIASTRTKLTSSTPLVELAQQFGRATGKNEALRTAIDVPDPRRYQSELQEHARGSILVAAVFDAFHTVYQDRIADLLRLATGGSGVLPPGSLHPDLVARVAREAVRTADQVLTICLRAFDYLPPVDVTFSDFLRAVVTSDRELFPTDAGGLRLAFIDAFRRRGIYPKEVASLAEASLLWPEVEVAIDLPGPLRAAMLALDALSFDLVLPSESAEGEVGGSAQPPVPSQPVAPPRSLAEARIDLEARTAAFLAPHAAAFGLSPKATTKVIGVQSMTRYDEDGAPHVTFVVQVAQPVDRADAPSIEEHLLASAIRRSATVIFDEAGRARHVVAKPLPADDLDVTVRDRAAARLDELTSWLQTLDARDAGTPFGLKSKGTRWKIDFASLHRRR